MPSRVVTFVSSTYERSISDRKLVEVSGLFETGDEIMADKDTRFISTTGRKITIFEHECTDVRQ